MSMDHQKADGTRRGQSPFTKASTAEYVARDGRDSEESDGVPTTISAREAYGFALFLFATLLGVLWVIWALTPDRLLKAAGLDWYPNREWAFLLPAWSLVAVLVTYTIFMSLNLYGNGDLADLSKVVDSHSNIHAVASDPANTIQPLRDTSSLLETGFRATNTQSRRKEAHERFTFDGPLAGDIYDLPPGLVSRLTPRWTKIEQRR
ncbi:N-acetylglucosaminyltransferase complex, subunit PIG-P, required for phosphatidylinositol biosynthesis [Ceraceosorus bombacis]|uniref:N-acetylglucosaminyltransferase complex, subunit PIG-P, required for phosphatidylinositol biosynthesis n=1 Tax=Ceraceosorus bombacis TaxID=401625 RepID=A0A0N7L9B6_9BASI|nr:N-acetylglucosaminyltransferase complex, subunit PIG-P, required for phosphatidylinositol biosynthesis [Ceraceosorus bombacis]